MTRSTPMRAGWLAGFVIMAAVMVLAALDAQAQPIGYELKLGFAYCASQEGYDVDAEACHAGSFAQVDTSMDLRVFIDAWRIASTHPHRLFEGTFTIVYDERYFDNPRGVLLNGLDPLYYRLQCHETDLYLDWMRADCWFWDTTPWEEGLPIVEGAELAIDLSTRGRTGLTSIVTEPWGGGASAQNQIADVVWEWDPFQPVLLGDYRQIGYQAAVEVLPAPEPSASGMGAAGTMLLVALYWRRRSRGFPPAS